MEKTFRDFKFELPSTAIRDFSLCANTVDNPNKELEILLEEKRDQLDDSQLEEVYNKQHSLGEIIAPDQFKSYEELKERFERVLGISNEGIPTTTAETIAEDNSDNFSSTVAEPELPISEMAEPTSSNEEKESLSYFEKLAADS